MRKANTLIELIVAALVFIVIVSAGVMISQNDIPTAINKNKSEFDELKIKVKKQEIEIIEIKRRLDIIQQNGGEK